MAKKDYPAATVAVIKSGIDQPFWKELKKIIKINVDHLTKQIVGDTKEDFTDEQRNQLIKWRALNQELVNLPDEIIASIEEDGATKPIDFDPYDRVRENA